MHNVLRFTCATFLVLAVWAGVAAPAPASEIVYVGADGNLYLTAPGGSGSLPLTQDATADAPYRDPALGDDGTISMLHGRQLVFLAQDGMMRTSLASDGGSETSSPPIGLDVSPAGEEALYWFMYDPPGPAAPFARVTSLIPGAGGGPCFLPARCHDDYGAPRWIPGTRDIAVVAMPDGRQLWVITRSASYLWISSSRSVIRGYDISRSGYRLLAEAVSPSAPAASELLYWENEITPPFTPSSPRYCVLDEFATGSADVSWAPDGTAFTWAGSEGIYVSPAPRIDDGSCAIRPRLIASGGTQPDWGEARAAPAPEPSPAPAAPGAQPPAALQTVSPVAIRELRVRPTTFRASRSGRSIATHGGARVSYLVSGPTVTRFTVERASRGMNCGRGGRGLRCVRYVKVPGSWTHASVEGANSFRFTGRVGGRRLRPGAYRLSATATSPLAARTLFAVR